PRAVQPRHTRFPADAASRRRLISNFLKGRLLRPMNLMAQNLPGGVQDLSGPRSRFAERLRREGMNMPSTRVRLFVASMAVVAIGVYVETAFSEEKDLPVNTSVTTAVQKGLKWLVAVQGKDGGWGQDGGETSYIRKSERLE